ncbi:MAG: cation:proton antiporter [Xanthomonadales bacterium]|nr:cation:proton antiporter [Xanthomonadales bacterium]
MHLLYVLLILLVVTRTGSEIAVRLKQPALVGELLGGVLLGILIVSAPESAEAIAELDSDQTFQAVLDLAVFFLMLLAGIEMRPAELARVSGKATPIALVGMILPLALGFGLGWWWLPASDWKLAQSLFIGVALAITAVPVAVKVLMDFDRLQSPVGQVVVAAAVIDDVLSLLLLAVLTSIITADQSVTPGLLLHILLNVAIFFTVAWVAGRHLLPRVGHLLKKLESEHADLSLLIIFALSLSVLAEFLGMHFLIGSFAAGLLFTRNLVGEDTHDALRSQTEAITLGFLAPVFFASIGIHLDIGAIVEAPFFLVVLLLAATVGKLAGSALTARLVGFSNRDSLAIGSAMNARGAVEIIIADIALRAGLFSRPEPTPPAIDYLFSAIVIMAILTTLSTPLTLRRALPAQRDDSD